MMTGTINSQRQPLSCTNEYYRGSLISRLESIASTFLDQLVDTIHGPPKEEEESNNKPSRPRGQGKIVMVLLNRTGRKPFDSYVGISPLFLLVFSP